MHTCDIVSAHSQSQQPERRKYSAFTLIELLIVIAVIAILAALLFPVFAQARENARKATCVSNIKQHFLGVHMYVEDYDEQMIPCITSLPSGQLKDAVVWQDLIKSYTRNRQICFCPDNPFQGKTFPSGLQDPPSFDYISSYGMTPVIDAINVKMGTNYASYVTRDSPWINAMVPPGMQFEGMAGFFDMGGVSTGIPQSRPATGVSLAAVARPSEYIFIYDASWFDGNFATSGTEADLLGYCVPSLYDGNGNPVDWEFYGPVPRHNNTNTDACDLSQNDANGKRGYDKGFSNICFMDGHAKSMKLSNMLKLTPDGTHLLYYTISQ